MIDYKFRLIIIVESRMNTLKNTQVKFRNNECDLVGADTIILNGGRSLCKKDYSITSYLDSNKYIKYTKIINDFSYCIHESQKQYLAEDIIIKELFNKLRYKSGCADVSAMNNPMKYDILSHDLIIDTDKQNQSLAMIISQIQDSSIKGNDTMIYGAGLNLIKTQDPYTPECSNKMLILKKRLIEPFRLIEHKICAAYIVGSDEKKIELSLLLPQMFL